MVAMQDFGPIQNSRVTGEPAFWSPFRRIVLPGGVSP
jgi:hypothetical protein